MDLTVWRYRRFHISYLLAWFAGGLLAGLIVGHTVNTGLNNAFWLLMSGILILGALRSQRWWAVISIVLAGVSLGLLRGGIVQEQYDAYQPLLSQAQTVTGRLSGDAQRSSSGRQKLTLASIEINGTHYPGEVFATVFSSAQLKRGDIVTVRGMVREGFASYGAALSAGKIMTIKRGNDAVRDIRERFSEAVRRVVMEPMASLGLGFVIGQRSTLPDSLDEQLKVVGLTHIVVASGYNLTILVRFIMRLLARYSRFLAFTGSLLMILSFVLFSGLSPSMNRAVIVTVLSLLAWYVGRRFHPVLLIAYVSAATAFVNPMYIWADLGWYLSFFAFAGILIVAPLVMRFLYRTRRPSPFEQLVIETTSAELTALPLIAFAFSTLPVFGLIANVLVGPFIPAAMALTATTGILGITAHAASVLVAFPTMILIGYMIAVVEWLASLPIAQYSLDLSIWVIILWYVALVAFCVYMQRRTGYNFRRRDPSVDM